MIKGNERRIIVLENLGDPYFERAVFYVRCGAAGRKDGRSLADRAQEIYDGIAAKETGNDGRPRPAADRESSPSPSAGTGRGTAERSRGGERVFTRTPPGPGAKPRPAEEKKRVSVFRRMFGGKQ